MYQFKAVTPRIQRQRDAIRNRVIRLDSEHAMLATEARKKDLNTIPIIQSARQLKYLAENLTLRVEDDDVLVGNRGRYESSHPHHPEAS